MSEELLPFEAGYLPEIYARKAKVELNESPENIINGLNSLRELVKKDSSMKGLEFEDKFLIYYLRVRKYNIARAYQLLKASVSIKRRQVESLSNVKYENISKAITCGGCNFLPYRCPDGCAVLVAIPGKWDPTDFLFEDLKRMVPLFLMHSLREPLSQINGFKVIFDCSDITLKQFRYFTPKNLYLLYHATQNCIPANYKAFHAVNLSAPAMFCWAVFKPLLSKKMRQRVYFHKNYESLHKHFPPKMLPAMWDGELEDYKHLEWLKKACTPENLANYAGPDVTLQK